MKDSELRTRAKAFALHMMAGCDAITNEAANALLQECGIIRRMLAKSITTAKTRKDDPHV